jgi:hypothetical protein
MKIRLLTAALLAASVVNAAEAPPNTLTPEEQRQGWMLLFDGTTMNNWDDPRQKNPPGDAWTIADGCLKANPHPGITEDLFSQKTYRDFELDWDWRISPGGNSGVKYRIQKHLWLVPRDVSHLTERFESQVERSFLHPVEQRPNHGQDYVIGFEYQLTDKDNGDAKSGAKHSAGALYDMVGPSSDMTRPTGEFNHSRIVLRGNHVVHWMNGTKIVDTSLDSPAALEGINTRWHDAPHVRDMLAKQPVKDCPISLQNHGDTAWFRNIKIRVLP